MKNALLILCFLEPMPQSAFEIQTPQFSGPLPKLLELIEINKLDISLVNLAKVTGDFIAYLKTVEQQLEQKILADFIVVAARLMLIKSKTLLPSLELTSEEEAEIGNLEKQLKLYREFHRAGQQLKNLFDAHGFSFSKTLLDGLAPTFSPANNLTLASLSQAFSHLANELVALVLPEEKSIKKHLFSVEEKMAELLARLQKYSELNFQKITLNKSRAEIVVLFLAILHLLKNQEAALTQGGQFDDIIIKKAQSKKLHAND